MNAYGNNFDDFCRRQMIAWACGTARQLGYTWSQNPDGSIDVKMGDNIHVASNWSEFARWMKEDLQEKIS